MLSKDSVVNQLHLALETGQRFESPYLMYWFKPFSDDDFSSILRYLPEDSAYLKTKHPDALRADGSSTRLSFVLKPERTSKLPPEQRDFWENMREILCSDDVRDVFKKWFEPALTERFGAPLSEIPAFPLPMLLRDLMHYKINIHPDTPAKVITTQVYLPETDANKDLGTTIYGRDDTGKFYVARKLEFLPNSGYSFAVTKSSWHGVDQIGEIATCRNSMMLVYYKEPHDEY